MLPPDPTLINARVAGNAIIASGVIRSYLESVIFKIDFDSSLIEANTITAESWKEALRQHVKNGNLPCEAETWITEMYGLLSVALHSGLVLTHGEVWAFGRLIDFVRDELAKK